MALFKSYFKKKYFFKIWDNWENLKLDKLFVYTENYWHSGLWREYLTLGVYILNQRRSRILLKIFEAEEMVGVIDEIRVTDKINWATCL